MALELYNTLTRKTEPFVPADPARVGVYCCGPTVYDHPHAGHARAALVPDLLVRRLRAKGYGVRYARNITDIDDKILKRSQENGETPLELSRRMAESYQASMLRLGCAAPDVEPRVSDHVPHIIELIERLIANEVAYAVDLSDGVRDVYFRVRRFPEYGKLSRRKIDDLVSGARVEENDSKEDPLDFALWKGAPRAEWGWDSPWGWGRPGWHIECSAMTCAHLGHGFDIHTGGMDLIFPHHENEIAQSEGARPGEGPMARFWLHNGFLNVDKEKMSKSLGNFVTVADVLARNDAEGFRWFLLAVQYRGPIAFETDQLPDGRVVFPGIDEAERRVDYLFATRARLDALVRAGVTTPGKIAPELQPLREQAGAAYQSADAALDDDLNSPVALASLGELCRLGNEIADLADKRRKDASFAGSAALVARGVSDAITTVCGWLGLASTPALEYAERTRAQRLALRGLTAADVDARLAERAAARAAKDFARGDALRDELLALGVTIKDGASGSSWTLTK